jgi:hypothetical protein
MTEESNLALTLFPALGLGISCKKARIRQGQQRQTAKAYRRTLPAMPIKPSGLSSAEKLQA